MEKKVNSDKGRLKISMKVEVFTEGAARLPCRKISKKILNRIALDVAEYLGLTGKIITLIVTDNQYMQEINRKYRNKNHPTDVISFAYMENPFPATGIGLENMGDIYISIEKAITQADEKCITLPEEIKVLLVHGILHLAGYDHEKSESKSVLMKRTEKKILSYINSKQY